MKAPIQSIQQYVWAPQVHSAFNEVLRFFFIRTAFAKIARNHFKGILNNCKTSTSTYLLFGQFDFLIRSWGALEDNNRLQKNLIEFAHENLGTCVTVESANIFYSWASEVAPSEQDIEAFKNEIEKLDPEQRHGFVATQYSKLLDQRIILSKVVDRTSLPLLRANAGNTLKAFTVIRNIKLTEESRTLIGMCLEESLRKYTTKGDDYDATLYQTKGDIDFIIRWKAPLFKELSDAVIALTETVESRKGAALFETYFVSQRDGEERDNICMLRVEKEHEDNTIKGWAGVLKSFNKAAPFRRDIFLSVCSAPETALSPEQVRRDRQLAAVLDAYFSEDVSTFAAQMLSYYGHFETKLRNLLLDSFWHPLASEKERDELLETWNKLLHKSKRIAEGQDNGRRVPKLALGDCVNLVLHTFKLNDPLLIQKIADLQIMRNRMSHYAGDVPIDLTYLSLFLSQVIACQSLLDLIREASKRLEAIKDVSSPKNSPEAETL